jgi:glyoxylase-like metal-dependent hydrolase (beta-lactamase superfamily II)/rhodanese-related sulfurtransferase
MKTILMLLLMMSHLWVQVFAADKPEQVNKPVGPPLSADAQKLLDEANQRIDNIDTEQLKKLLSEVPETVLIDVRSPQEITLLGGHIDSPRHRNIMRGWLDLQVDSYIPDKDAPIVVYCGVNQRSPLAADRLMQLGYKQVKNYADGFFAWQAAGLPVESYDKALNSPLYQLPEEVIPGVWSAIGATAPPTYDNSGHNNNLSFVITEAGVVVMNAGESYLLAAALHDEIKQHTDQSVKYVVMENGQGHAMLGANYWKEQGAKLVIHKNAWEYFSAAAPQVKERAMRRRDKMFRTELVEPDIIMGQEKLDLSLGSWKIEVLYLGAGHTPGGVVLWLPEKKLAITGDLAFHERLLPIFEVSDTAGWIETWDKLVALGPEHLIPGHGGPTTDLAELARYTRDYLVYLRTEISALLDAGGTLSDAYKIDQSAYSHLDTFDELALRNVSTLYKVMEFE